MKYLFFFPVLTFLLCASPQLKAQDFDDEHSFGERLALSLALGNHSVGFPLQNQLKAFHPAISNLGLECRLNRSRKHSLLLGARTSLIANEVVGNSLLLGLDLSYRYTHPSGIYTQLAIEMGALSQRSARDAFPYPSLSDGFEAETLSQSSSYSGLAWYLGYQLKGPRLQNFSLFLSQRFFIQTPYFAVAAFEIMPQNLLSIGLRYQIQTPFDKQ